MALKKKFIEIELPIISEEIPVLGDVETLVGRTIKLDLSRKLRGKGLEVVFAIMNKEGKLVGYPKNLTLMRSYIQRMMRKRISYVEDSFLTSAKDVPVTIKPFLITRKKVSRAIRNSLRRTTKDFLVEYCKDKTYIELCDSIITGNMQKEMHPKLKKVYPLSLCEIRVFETKDVLKADLTTKVREEKEKEKVEESEKTQAEEIEEELKEKAKKAKKEKVEEVEEKE